MTDVLSVQQDQMDIYWPMNKIMRPVAKEESESQVLLATLTTNTHNTTYTETKKFSNTLQIYAYLLQKSTLI